jgi:hypothetical protein
MKHTGLAIALLTVAAALHGPCLAQAQPIGYVKTVSGDAWVTDAGQQVKAVAGTPVQLGSRLRTATGASLGITLKDNTLLSFGPDTELVLDEFAYEPAKGQLGLVASLARGTLSYISGVIAKLRPEAVSVKTPAGLIGVRGTEFAVRVELPR